MGCHLSVCYFAWMVLDNPKWNMEYIRPKLKINRYKKQPPNILFQNIAQEIDHATRAKLNFSLDYDLLLWLIRLISLNPVYGTAQNRFFDRAAVDALITDYLEIVSGNLVFQWNAAKKGEMHLIRALLLFPRSHILRRKTDTIRDPMQHQTTYLLRQFGCRSIL